MTISARSNGWTTVAIFALLGPPVGSLTLFVAFMLYRRSFGPLEAEDIRLVLVIGYFYGILPMALAGLAVALSNHMPLATAGRGIIFGALFAVPAGVMFGRAWIMGIMFACAGAVAGLVCGAICDLIRPVRKS
jgi:hypothetical protein